VLLISGSTRAASTNSALCRTAVVCAPAGVAALRSAIASADAVLFCTPEYAGTLPGSFKNLLDWTVGGTELTAKPVAWVKVAADERRGAGAHATLATVLGYVQARVVEDACRHVPIARDTVGADGVIADSTTRSQIAATIEAVLDADPATFRDIGRVDSIE
jgi:chromate reductase